MSSDVTETDVEELTDHLSAYLQRVEEGETITVTRKGRPVGRLVPAQDKREADEADGRSREEKLEALQESGMAKWSGKKFSPTEPKAEVKGDRMVSDLLLEDRR